MLPGLKPWLRASISDILGFGAECLLAEGLALKLGAALTQ